MDSQPVDNSTKEKAAQEALRALARIIVKMYLLEHPLPYSEGTLPSIYLDGPEGGSPGNQPPPCHNA